MSVPAYRSRRKATNVLGELASTLAAPERDTGPRAEGWHRSGTAPGRCGSAESVELVFRARRHCDTRSFVVSVVCVGVDHRAHDRVDAG